MRPGDQGSGHKKTPLPEGSEARGGKGLADLALGPPQHFLNIEQGHFDLPFP